MSSAKTFPVCCEDCFSLRCHCSPRDLNASSFPWLWIRQIPTRIKLYAPPDDEDDIRRWNCESWWSPVMVLLLFRATPIGKNSRGLWMWVGRRTLHSRGWHMSNFPCRLNVVTQKSKYTCNSPCTNKSPTKQNVDWHIRLYWTGGPMTERERESCNAPTNHNIIYYSR